MDIEASNNFRRISDALTTSGVVAPESLQALAAQGYGRVINLLPDDSAHAVAGEREIVAAQGIDYMHIPVDFARPGEAEFARFSVLMDAVGHGKLHVHCAANYRVSAFYGRYAVARGLWNVEQAWDLIRGLWNPEEHPGWPAFLAPLGGDGRPGAV